MIAKLFAEIQDEDDAMTRAKGGGLGILLFSILSAAGVLYGLDKHESLLEESDPEARELILHVLRAMVIGWVLLLLFAAWRVFKGRGWFAGALVFVWYLVEMAFKYTGGGASIHWILFHFAVGAALFNGVRACWWLRKKRRAAAVVRNDAG